jgi:hypothetical protein
VHAIQGSYSRSAIWGKGPEKFTFKGNLAFVHGRDHEVQQIVSHFKDWLGPAHQIYVSRLEQRQREAEASERQRLKKAADDVELRQAVLSKIKF